MSSPTVLERLKSATDAGFKLSSQFLRICQVVPSAVDEYATFSELILHLSLDLEQIGSILPSFEFPGGAEIFSDLVKLIDIIDAAYDDAKVALPTRDSDGELDLDLPLEVDALVEQLGALLAGTALIVTVLVQGRLGPQSCLSDKVTLFIHSCKAIPSRQGAEALVQQILRIIKTLQTSQLKTRGRRATLLKRTKAHEAIAEWLSALIIPGTTAANAKDDETEEKDKVENTDTTKNSSNESEKADAIKSDHLGANPVAEDTHSRIRPSGAYGGTYTKLHTKDIDERSLKSYGLPWTKLKDDPDYYIIWKFMSVRERDDITMHSLKLRIDDEQASILPKEVIDNLLKKWAHVNPADFPVTVVTIEESDLEQFEKDLQELKEQDEAPNDNSDSDSSRSLSPPPMRIPGSRRRSTNRSISPFLGPPPPPPFAPGLMHPSPPGFQPSAPPGFRFPSPLGPKPPRRGPQKTQTISEYWRPWGEQPTTQKFSSLRISLTAKGWQPVYMRGNDAGQTWFYGPNIVHIRRFDESYTPQEGPMKPEACLEIQEYLLMSGEWIETDALYHFGFTFKTAPSGQYSLDPRLTWRDIELLVGFTSSIREDRLYTKYRNLPGGDLHQPRKIAVPGFAFLHGPYMPEMPEMPPPPPPLLVPPPPPLQDLPPPLPYPPMPPPPPMPQYSSVTHTSYPQIGKVKGKKKSTQKASSVDSDDSFVEITN